MLKQFITIQDLHSWYRRKPLPCDWCKKFCDIVFVDGTCCKCHQKFIPTSDVAWCSVCVKTLDLEKIADDWKTKYQMKLTEFSKK